MPMLPHHVLFYGSETPLPERHTLRAGPLEVLYEAGDLRYIRLGTHEVLRRVYSAVRDANWGTITPELSDEQIETGDNWFIISYTAHHRRDPINFSWRGTITGTADGTITFTMDGEAHSTFQRNRIGFCILHPVRECAGVSCTIEHVNGELTQKSFPRLISPHQPFFDIRAITHEIKPGLQAEVRFIGDAFEMEDQRNWTDASFKTYCTPLRIPYPVEVRQGTRITQSVTISLKGDPSIVSPMQTSDSKQEQAVTISLGEPEQYPLPRLGLGIASHGQPLTEREIERLKQLHLSHLRVDLDLAQSDYVATLQRATQEARALQVTLEVALHLSENAENELAQLKTNLQDVQPPVSTWLIFAKQEKSTGERWLVLARSYLAAYAPLALFGGGTNAYFTELNRGRPVLSTLDLVNFSINPQVHAFDNASLVETLEAQRETVHSARSFCGDRLLTISPVTLKPRFNPDTTGPEITPPADELPPQVDVRQMSLFGAGWTVGSLKYLSEGAVYSITYYETTGWRGVMETEAGSPQPEQFRSIPGAVFPLYHVLANFGEFAGGSIIPLKSDRPLHVDGCALYKDGRTRVLLANLTDTSKFAAIPIASKEGQMSFTQHLVEGTTEWAMTTPEQFRAAPGMDWPIDGELIFELLPYAVLRIDF